MRDYKLSELKEICNKHSCCNLCPLIKLCNQLDNGVAFFDLKIDDIDDIDDEENNNG